MLNLTSYIHSIDPFALQFGSGFGIRWYGLAYLAGFAAAWLIIKELARRGLSPLSPALAADFVVSAAFGTIIGGRLGYCIFYSPELLVSFSSEPPFWGVLMLHKGGMASHGGMAGILVSCVLFARRHGQDYRHLLDLTTLGGTVGIFFGRMANFVNAELLGRAASPQLAWAVRFPQELYGWSTEQLAKLTDVVAAIGIAQERWLAMIHSGSGADIQRAIDSVVAQVQAGNAAVTARLAPLLTPRHPSQIYEALLEGALLFVLLSALWRKPRKPGFIAGAFLVLYAIVRVIGEQFRLPDPHIGYQIFNLTRGQILSLGLLILGIAALISWSRRNSSAIGGWGGALQRSTKRA